MKADEIRALVRNTEENITYLTGIICGLMKRIDANSNAIDMMWLELKNGIIEVDDGKDTA